MRRHGRNGIGSFAPICMARSSVGERRRGGWSPPARADASSTFPRFTKKPAMCRMTVLTVWPRAESAISPGSMALELGPHGITVNDVAPGMILTPMNQRALDDRRLSCRGRSSDPAPPRWNSCGYRGHGGLPLLRSCVLLHRRDVSRRWRLDADLAAGLGKDQPMIAARRPKPSRSDCRQRFHARRWRSRRHALPYARFRPTASSSTCS